MFEGKPVRCMYCGEVVGPHQPAMVVERGELDENGQPAFSGRELAGVAHVECWDREGPKQGS